MQVKVTIEGHGSYSIDTEKLGELLGWLSVNNGVRVQKEPIREVIDNQFTGKELISESYAD